MEGEALASTNVPTVSGTSAAKPHLTYEVPDLISWGTDVHWDASGGVTVRVAARPLWRQVLGRVAEIGIVTVCFTAPVSLMVFFIARDVGGGADWIGLLPAALICVGATAYTVVRLVNVCRFGRLPTTIQASPEGLRVAHLDTLGMRERVWPTDSIVDVDAEYVAQTGSIAYAVQLKVKCTSKTFRFNLNSSDWIFQEKLRNALRKALWREPIQLPAAKAPTRLEPPDFA